MTKVPTTHPTARLRREYIGAFEERVADVEARPAGPEAMLRRRLLPIAALRAEELDGTARGVWWSKIHRAWRACGWADLFQNRRSGTIVAALRHCDQPLCPYCAPRRLAVHRRRYGPAFAKPATEKRLYFIVLTVPNVPLGELEVTIARLRDGMVRLRRRRGAWLQLRAVGGGHAKAIGGLTRLEVTRNIRQRTWHPHLNVIVETDRPVLMREWQPLLKKNWPVCVGEVKAWPWLREAGSDGEKDLREALKYTIKPDPSFVDPKDPRWVVEYLEATHGHRLLNSFGTWRKLPEPKAEIGEETHKVWSQYDEWRPRKVPVLDPFTDEPTKAEDWTWRGDGPLSRLRPVRPAGDERSEWWVWHPASGLPSPIDAWQEQDADTRPPSRQLSMLGPPAEPSPQEDDMPLPSEYRRALANHEDANRSELRTPDRQASWLDASFDRYIAELCPGDPPDGCRRGRCSACGGGVVLRRAAVATWSAVPIVCVICAA